MAPELVDSFELCINSSKKVNENENNDGNCIASITLYQSPYLNEFNSLFSTLLNDFYSKTLKNSKNSNTNLSSEKSGKRAMKSKKKSKGSSTTELGELSSSDESGDIKICEASSLSKSEDNFSKNITNENLIYNTFTIYPDYIIDKSGISNFVPNKIKREMEPLNYKPLSRKFMLEFDIIKKEKQSTDTPIKFSGRCCFNCGSKDHILSACPEQHDQDLIKTRRDLMDKNKSKYFIVYDRYHNSEHSGFDKFKPGQISDQLIKALGINQNQLPPYIYKMRKLGYPPGYLHESFIKDQVVDTSEIEHSSSNLPSTKPKSHIFLYPGFNTSIPEGVVDEYTKFGCPKMI